GDGSMATPFARIAAAIRTASSGDTIALSKGTFSDPIDLSKPLALVGACASGTRIEGPMTASSKVEIRDLSIGGPSARLIVVRAGAIIATDRAVLEIGQSAVLDNLVPAISAAMGARVRIDESFVRDASEYGLQSFGATLSIDRTRIDRTGRAAVYVVMSTAVI